jgi:ferredoxin-NADP reductase
MKARIDTVLGRVTMYNLVIAVLGALIVIAFVASASGQLFYTPGQLLLHLVVALLATVASSWLFARLFRTRSHLPSAVITAQLIFFVFMPTADPSGLLLLALAGVLASASKFVLAWRGRHIFNPVAAAAVIMSLTTLYPSAWWVATPVLLPFVAVGALLVLYRTHRLALGLSFIVLALAITVVRLMLLEAGFGDALWLAIGSFPVVFLAGFMLTEPLTLPPRRWQQFTVAGVVAILFSSGLNIGPVYFTPEIALVVGNAIAFAFGQRRGVSLRYLGSRALTPTSAEFDFEPAAPLRFRPGQYVEMSLPHRKTDARGGRRVFSIASAPDSPVVSIGLKTPTPGSSFKAALQTLEPGTTVRATTVGGDFLLPSDPAAPVLLAAGGIGITPFISQLASRARGGSGGAAESADAAAPARAARAARAAGPSDVVLVYSVSSADELAYRPELEAAGIRVLVTAPTEPASLPTGWEYLGAGRLTRELLRAAVPDVASRHAYVSGPPGFVDHVATELRRAGARAVRTDQFAGY